MNKEISLKKHTRYEDVNPGDIFYIQLNVNNELVDIPMLKNNYKWSVVVTKELPITITTDTLSFLLPKYPGIMIVKNSYTFLPEHCVLKCVKKDRNNIVNELYNITHQLEAMKQRYTELSKSDLLSESEKDLLDSKIDKLFMHRLGHNGT